MLGPPGRGRGGDLSNVNTRSGIKVTKFGKQSQECWSQSQSLTFAEAAAAGGSSRQGPPPPLAGDGLSVVLPSNEWSSQASGQCPPRCHNNVTKPGHLQGRHQCHGSHSGHGDHSSTLRGHDGQNRCHHCIAKVLCRP